MAGAVQAVDDRSFGTEVLESHLPVLVDFWADWCGPCKAVARMVEQLAGEFSGLLKVCALDVDGSHAIASEYGVMSLPTIILFRGGRPVLRLAGAVPSLADLRCRISQVLAIRTAGLG